MKKLYNPLDKELKITYKGEDFSIGPKSAKEFPDMVAEWWKKNIHPFLLEIEVTPQKEVVQEIVEKIEETRPLTSLEEKIAKEVAKKTKKKE